VDEAPTIPNIKADVTMAATNASGWFPTFDSAGKQTQLFTPIDFDDKAQKQVPSTCFFEADVAGYKAGDVLDPTRPVLVPVGTAPVTFQVYCHATDINGGISEKLQFPVTLKVGGGLGRAPRAA
jgi:hypothetical protein